MAHVIAVLLLMTQAGVEKEGTSSLRKTEQEREWPVLALLMRPSAPPIGHKVVLDYPHNL